MEHVSWTQMEDGTKEDYEFLGVQFAEHSKQELVPNLVNLLKVMEGPKLGYQIDRYQHSLQSATRALRNDESLDMVVAALLHDVGDAIAPENHSAVAATMLKPYVDEETHWVIQHHGLFQGDAADRRLHPDDGRALRPRVVGAGRGTARLDGGDLRRLKQPHSLPRRPRTLDGCRFARSSERSPICSTPRPTMC